MWAHTEIKTNNTVLVNFQNCSLSFIITVVNRKQKMHKIVGNKKNSLNHLSSGYGVFPTKMKAIFYYRFSYEFPIAHAISFDGNTLLNTPSPTCQSDMYLVCTWSALWQDIKSYYLTVSLYLIPSTITNLVYKQAYVTLGFTQAMFYFSKLLQKQQLI